jgi:hypothetical protein
MGTGVAPAPWPPAMSRRRRIEGGSERSASGQRKVERGRACACKAGQAARAISTARLRRLPALHLPPIDVLVSNGPFEGLRAPQRARLLGGPLYPGSACLGESFPLRCFQRFSRPNLATRRCRRRDSRHTRGSSIPVLSYWGRLPATLQRPRRIQTELSHDVLNPAHVPL